MKRTNVLPKPKPDNRTKAKPRKPSEVKRHANIRNANIEHANVRHATSKQKKIIESGVTKPDETRRESMAGVHYAMLYDACQWRYYLMYGLGIETLKKDKALIAGSAFHEAKAVFYTEKSLSAALARGTHDITEARADFYNEEDFQFALSRIEPMFTNWYHTYGKDDFDRYDVTAVEQEFRLPIPFTNGYVTTQRHDAILQDKEDGKYITGETKTASSSLDFTLNTVRLSSQVIAYIWGGKEVFKDKYKGLMVDVTYWSSRSKNTSTIKSQRSELIVKSPHEIKSLQVNMAAIFNEIDAKDRALLTGVSPEFLYRRNTYYCYAYFRQCPYASVCGLNVNDVPKQLPAFLHVVDFERRLDSMTYDPYFSGESGIS